MDAVRERLLAKLRQLAPARVRVYDNSDEHRDVAVPQRRRRWAQVIETIESRPWVRVVMLDKAGAELGVVENEGAPGELEDLPDGGPRGAVSHRWFLEMMIKAQTTALAYRDKEHAALLEGMREMMAVQTQTMRELVQLYAVQRDVAADIAAMQAAAENSGNIDQLVKLIEASPQLLQVVGPMLGMLLGGKRKLPPSPPNGAAK